MIRKSHTKYIQSLHHKKFRDENAVFIAEGEKVVLALLGSGRMHCLELFGHLDWFTAHEPEIRKNFNGLLQDVSAIEMAKMSALQTPSPVLAVFRKKKTTSLPSLEGRISLALDTIQDPGNLGTLIRIADWFGISTIYCSLNCADQYNPKVVQSTMGSLAMVDVMYTDLFTLLENAPSVNLIAATLNGKPVNSFGKIQEGVLMIGNESKGLGDELIRLSNLQITIPRIGHAESLNAAVAAGIILSHLC